MQKKKKEKRKKKKEKRKKKKEKRKGVSVIKIRSLIIYPLQLLITS
jgi:hypothetical protein